jgi:acyl carrier protein
LASTWLPSPSIRTPRSSALGLGIDSIDTLELVVMIDKDYGVKIDNRAAGIEAFASLNALAAFIRQHRPASPA